MVVVLAGGTIFQSDILTQNLYTSTNDLLGRGLRPSVFKGASGSWSNFVENPPYYDVDVYSWDRSFLLAPSIDGGLVPSFLVFQDCHLQCHILSSVKTPCASYRFVSFFWTARIHCDTYPLWQLQARKYSWNVASQFAKKQIELRFSCVYGRRWSAQRRFMHLCSQYASHKMLIYAILRSENRRRSKSV